MKECAFSFLSFLFLGHHLSKRFHGLSKREYSSLKNLHLSILGHREVDLPGIFDMNLRSCPNMEHPILTIRDDTDWTKSQKEEMVPFRGVSCVNNEFRVVARCQVS